MPLRLTAGGAPAARQENTIRYPFVTNRVFEERKAAGEKCGAAKQEPRAADEGDKV